MEYYTQKRLDSILDDVKRYKESQLIKYLASLSPEQLADWAEMHSYRHSPDNPSRSAYVATPWTPAPEDYAFNTDKRKRVSIMITNVSTHESKMFNSIVEGADYCGVNESVVRMALKRKGNFKKGLYHPEYLQQAKLTWSNNGDLRIV